MDNDKVFLKKQHLGQEQLLSVLDPLLGDDHEKRVI
jgi:hypothetical protein